MSVATFDQGPKAELLLRCNCGSNHFLAFTYWNFSDDIDDPDDYVDIIEEWRTPHGLIGRFKAAWELFWKGEHHSASAGMDREDLKRIVAWCRQRLGS